MEVLAVPFMLCAEQLLLALIEGALLYSSFLSIYYHGTLSVLYAAYQSTSPRASRRDVDSGSM